MNNSSEIEGNMFSVTMGMIVQVEKRGPERDKQNLFGSNNKNRLFLSQAQKQDSFLEMLNLNKWITLSVGIKCYRFINNK